MRRRTARRQGSVAAEMALHVATGGFALLCVIPFLLIVAISFTDEQTLATHGYSFLPSVANLHAYQYVIRTGDQLLRSYGVSIVVTLLGTALGLAATALYAYALSRREFRWRGAFTFVAVFTMLFNGGLIPFYLVCTKLLSLHNSLWSLILPLLINPFFIIIMRTFFQTTVPDSIIEAARIDGAGEMTTFTRIILPIALPGLATIGLFIALGYWNDWFNALLFITKSSLTPVQYLLMRIESSMNFLVQNASILQTMEGKSILQSIPLESTRMALVVLATVPIVIAYPFFQRYFVRGLTLGSIKG
jgi:putative aldouronate transport system permease protein